MDRPSYTPTDYVPLAGTVLLAVLDGLTMAGKLNLTQAQEVSMVAVVTTLATFLLSVFVGHRAVKQALYVRHQGLLIQRELALRVPALREEVQASVEIKTSVPSGVLGSSRG
jgi:hypothetical protein